MIKKKYEIPVLLSDEMNRKIIHMLTILYPVVYNMVSRSVALIIAGSFVIVDVILEFFRFVSPKFNKRIIGLLYKGMYRTEEVHQMSGLPWTLTGGFLTIFFFPDKRIVTTAFLYVVFGDTIAALVGVSYGKTKIRKNKSLEGSLACFLVCFLCGIFFLPLELAFAGAVVATIIEFLPLPLNDNFWLPLISSFVLTLLKK
ncbi:MAG: hypothetical protein AUJ85_04065 [Elusimicrobia bacterium CG1_02_37_114]|nr:MAG: hypothetical protein AUJ85_04065 [Elusimicrobia bacterium CG1_02_37_114]PIV54153.1 MAG: hypothetical protein COS17_00090 [Elusimicrobia bacterium CG02_land_8_20_14_3_00_37_13]PIZ12520.1 MAG: hypothetical protein COY53_09630 [Elusimicrobia bacterium CG_4_10_14_0_8_um_filter_37_32]